MTRVSALLGPSLLLAFSLAGGCGSDDDDGAGGSAAAGGTGGIPEQTGSACEAPSDCYPGIAPDALKGAVVCLDRVTEGYCTHECATVEDCCAAPGECKTGLKQVCSPFESTGKQMCFLSCEKADLNPADAGPDLDDTAYCQREISTSFICRSSGGGSDNRKVCVPADCGIGSACTGDANCDTGQVCLTTARGGYCGIADCTVNADCPNGALCAKHSDGRNYCLRACQGDGDCATCRPLDVASTCRADATLLEPGTGSVCVPPS